MNKGKVGLVDGASFELRLEMAVGMVVFGDQDDARGILVQAVDDARPLDAAHALEVRAVIEDGVDKGAAIVSGRGVDDQAGGFVDDDKVAVLVENDEGDRFRRQGGGFGGRDVHPDAVADLHALGGSGWTVVDQHMAIVDPALDFGARVWRQLLIRKRSRR